MLVHCFKIQPMIWLRCIRSVLLRVQTEEADIFAVDLLKCKYPFRRVRKAGRRIGKPAAHERLDLG